MFARLWVSHSWQKPLPLDTPVVLHLTPTKTIQVTLFDANHCPGSVMFRKCLQCRCCLP